eukprot:CAMPEP_0203884908 /NCGR_PEP_ID=MMETSP0359-20131031/28915_1 /ASSEMBLY_ACC=CAM_ASM_000338 /TAXON_ID=268821 /ORGANISM="Scrippsiella Hangoei, Strain SHTV-5" /LENGTH=329 /DNA_ID=CAMNT_0050805443 /DNA_START=65 /DNA_END=1054 /DNA_ORIENTATION=+
MLQRLPHVLKFKLGWCELTKVLFKLEDGALTETVFSEALASRGVGGGLGSRRNSSSSSLGSRYDALRSSGPGLASLPDSVGTDVAMRNTVCVSSQIGCRRMCGHCSSGGRFQRDLTASEIVGQVAAFAVDHEIGHVVFQGTGEPLDNPAVCHAAHFLATSFHKLTCTCDGVDCGPNEAQTASQPTICVSTVGSSSGIRQMSLVAPENLSLMLSAMPDVERGEPLSELLDCSDEFAARTGRPVALSYTMIEGLDTEKHIDGLLEHMRGRMESHVLQLVQYHPNCDALPSRSSPVRPSTPTAIRHCVARLREHGCRVGFGQYCEFPSALLA